MSNEDTKTLARVVFSDDQRKQIKKFSGRDVEAMRVVELSEEQTRTISPGLLKATAVVMCW